MQTDASVLGRKTKIGKELISLTLHLRVRCRLNFINIMIIVKCVECTRLDGWSLWVYGVLTFNIVELSELLWAHFL